MLPLTTCLSFAALAFVMALSPGPNLLYLASRSVCQGARAGFASLAGVCAAMSCYVLATAGGLSALFTVVPAAYDIVRYAGATYLIWLAIQALRTPWLSTGTTVPPPETYPALFRRGFTTCLLNPKIVLMYGSLLPQFVHPEAGSPLVQTVILGLIQVAVAGLAHAGVILGASRISRLLRGSPRFIRGQRVVLATLLAAVALRVVFDKRHVA
jgi:threonine/homoserine/homoserine lactone efflux protein